MSLHLRAPVRVPRLLNSTRHLAVTGRSSAPGGRWGWRVNAQHRAEPRGLPGAGLWGPRHGEGTEAAGETKPVRGPRTEPGRGLERS